MPHFVYILQSLRTGAYYTGSTQNISDRIERHNQNRVKATKSKGPWKLVYTEEFLSRSDAVKREYEIKARKSKVYIDNLVRASRQY
jgi:putative endonuclease